MRWMAMFALFGLLSGCGGGENENLPTAEESQGLNEAAAMLDAAPDDLNMAPVDADDGTAAGNSGAEAR